MFRNILKVYCTSVEFISIGKLFSLSSCLVIYNIHIYCLGIISNIGAETLGFGPVAPFVVALAPLVLCGVLVSRTWEENYGNRKTTNLGSSCMEGLRIIFGDENILLLGTIQVVPHTTVFLQGRTQGRFLRGGAINSQ